MFATELPADDHRAAQEVLSQVNQWNRPPGRYYDTAEATQIDHPLLKGCARAFFIRIPSGERVYRHRDPPEVTEHFDTDHIVVSTNDRSFICWEENGTDRSVHLELGKRYRIIDRGLLHWAVNDGETDRIHLLIEYPKESAAGIVRALSGRRS
jgi:hypothetical protein